MRDMGLPKTNDPVLMKNTIKSYLKRNTLEHEKKCIDSLRGKILMYEMSQILDSEGLSKPIDKTQYFDYMRSNLEFIEREPDEIENDEKLAVEDFTKTKISEIITEEEAEPEYSEEDEEAWELGYEMVGVFRKIS